MIELCLLCKEEIETHHNSYRVIKHDYTTNPIEHTQGKIHAQCAQKEREYNLRLQERMAINKVRQEWGARDHLRDDTKLIRKQGETKKIG